MPAVSFFVALAGAAIVLLGCGRHQDIARAAYVPLADVEVLYGPLITAGNHPTRNQNGTGERVGLFRGTDGTIWGLPLTIAKDGAVLACAPPALQGAGVTDTFPSGATIIGATNQPTGWRGGTGNLEIILREAGGGIRWQEVGGSQLKSGPVCWAAESPGPPQQLDYYRLIPAAH